MGVNQRKIFAGLVILSLSLGGWAQEACSEEEKPSPELLARGEELFTKKQPLGVKYECMTCHKGAKAIQRSKVKLAGEKLPDVINKYLLEKAKGTKPLSKDSDEMKALAAFIKYKHSI